MQMWRRLNVTYHQLTKIERIKNGCAWTPNHRIANFAFPTTFISQSILAEANAHFKQYFVKIMIGHFLWDNLNLPAFALVQGACSVFAFSWYHRLVLQVFAVGAPFWIAMGTSVAPDKLDLVFLIAMNAV